VALLQPATLDEAVKFAHAYEQRNNALAKLSTGTAKQANRSFSRQTFQATLMNSAAGSAASLTGKPATKMLSLAEIAERRHKGQCFHCDDLFTNGHRDVCKQLFMIELIDDTDESAFGTPEGPTISLHTNRDSTSRVAPCS
jgi:hypothetical protein